MSSMILPSSLTITYPECPPVATCTPIATKVDDFVELAKLYGQSPDEITLDEATGLSWKGNSPGVQDAAEEEQKEEPVPTSGGDDEDNEDDAAPIEDELEADDQGFRQGKIVATTTSSSASPSIGSATGTVIGDMMQSTCCVLVRPAADAVPTGVSSAIKRYGECQELPMPTPVQGLSDDYAQCPEMFEVDALNIAAWAFTYARAALPPIHKSAEYVNMPVPGPVYFLDARQPHQEIADITADRTHARFTSSREGGVIAIVALNTLTLHTIIAPATEVLTPDDGAETAEQVAERIIYAENRAVSACAAKGDSDEFVIRDADTLSALADAWVEYTLQPGDVFLLKRSQPWKLIPKDGVWPRVAITTPILDFAGPPSAHAGGVERMDIVRAYCRGGVFRKGRWGVDIPMKPGSSAGVHQASTTEQWPVVAQRPGDDELLAMVNPVCSEVDVRDWATRCLSSECAWGFFYPSTKMAQGRVDLIRKGTAVNAAIAGTLSEHGVLAYYTCVGSIKLAAYRKCIESAVTVGIKPLTATHGQRLEKAIDVQWATVNRFRTVKLGTIIKHIETAETTIGAAMATIDVRLKCKDKIPSIQRRMNALVTLASCLPDGGSKRLQVSVATMQKRVAAFIEKSREKTLEKVQKSFDLVVGLIESAEAKALPGHDAKKENKSRSHSASEGAESHSSSASEEGHSAHGDDDDDAPGDSYPDPDTHVPEPRVEEDPAMLLRFFEKATQTFRHKKKELKAKKEAGITITDLPTYESILGIDKKRGLYAECAKIRAAYNAKEPYDISKTVWLLCRLEYYPVNPLKAMAAEAADAAKKRKRAATNEVECLVCGSDRLLSLTVQAKGNFPTRCLACAGDNAQHIAKIVVDTIIRKHNAGELTKVTVKETESSARHKAASMNTEERILSQIEEIRDTFGKVQELYLDVEDRGVVKGRPGQAWARFSEELVKLQGQTGVFSPSEVGNLWEDATEQRLKSTTAGGDDEEYCSEDVRSEGAQFDNNWTDCCDALLLPTGKCSDCGNMAPSLGESEGEADDDDEAMEEQTRSQWTEERATEPSGGRPSPAKRSRVKGSAATLADAPTSQLYTELLRRVPGGPDRDSHEAIVAYLRDRETNAQIPAPTEQYALYVSTKRTTSPETGESGFSREDAVRIGDPDNSFLSMDACKTWARTAYNWYGSDDAHSPMFIAKVYATKRKVNSDEGPASPAAKKSRV